MPTLTQAVADYTDSITPGKPEKGFLGAFVDGSFQTTVTTDPSLAWVRDERNLTTTAKHHGRVNLATTNENLPIELYYDENNDFAILGYDRDQGGAVLELDPGATIPAHTHAGEDVTSGTVAAAHLGVMTGDAGAGGAKGAVPAPAAGDTAGGKYLKADATWDVPPGAGGSGSLVTVGNYADSRPAAPSAGDTFLIKDGYWKEVYHDSAWNPWRSEQQLAAPPTSGWSWVNQSTSTIDESKGAFYFEAPMSTGSNVRARIRTQPGKPYTITAQFKLGGMGTSIDHGLMWTDGTKLVTLSFSNGGLRITKYNSVTSISANYVSLSSTILLTNDAMWLRIADDNTNRICSYSLDGKNWVVLHSVGNTDFLTATDVGYFVDPVHASQTQRSSLVLLSWKEA